MNDFTQTLILFLTKLFDVLSGSLARIEAQMALLVDDIAALKQASSDISGDVTAIGAAVQTLKDKIAAGGGVTPTDLADIEAAVASLQGSHTGLQAAVTNASAP